MLIGKFDFLVNGFPFVEEYNRAKNLKSMSSDIELQVLLDLSFFLILFKVSDYILDYMKKHHVLSSIVDRPLMPYALRIFACIIFEGFAEFFTKFKHNFAININNVTQQNSDALSLVIIGLLVFCIIMALIQREGLIPVAYILILMTLNKTDPQKAWAFFMVGIIVVIAKSGVPKIISRRY